MRACRTACSARASAARASFVRRRRTAIPATTSSCAVRDAGGSGAGSTSASARSASSMRPIRSRRRTSRCRACAALTRSPRASSVARAASSVFAGQPRSRVTSAISASATTHRARATASPAPNARAALRRSAFGASEIAELRHRDPSQREGGRVVAQGDPLQCADRIARGERLCRGGDQRVHRNPVTLVTLTLREPTLSLSPRPQPRRHTHWHGDTNDDDAG